MGSNWVEVQWRCSTCDGTGTYHGPSSEQAPCPECNGEGYVDTRMRVRIKPMMDKLDDIWERVK